MPGGLTCSDWINLADKESHWPNEQDIKLLCVRGTKTSETLSYNNRRSAAVHHCCLKISSKILAHICCSVDIQPQHPIILSSPYLSPSFAPPTHPHSHLFSKLRSTFRLFLFSSTQFMYQLPFRKIVSVSFSRQTSAWLYSIYQIIEQLSIPPMYKKVSKDFLFN